MRVTEVNAKVGQRFEIEVEFLHHVNGRECSIIVTVDDLIEETRSVVCTMNDLQGQLPDYVTIKDMDNEWIIQRNKIPNFLKWFSELEDKELTKWFINDQKEGGWLT